MFSRHELVWLDARGWQKIIDTAAAEHQPALRGWQDFPLVVRRTDDGIDDDKVCLGLPFPPDARTGHKLRHALTADRTDIAKRTLPLPLAEVIATAPAHWRSQLQMLAQDALALNVSLRVYGSLALQALTGHAYVRPQSDIDILLRIEQPQQLQAGLDLLQQHSQYLPLDGELMLPSGAAVSWKEWRNAQASAAGTRVLVKEMQTVRLTTIAALLTTEFAQPCLP